MRIVIFIILLAITLLSPRLDVAVVAGAILVAALAMSFLLRQKPSRQTQPAAPRRSRPITSAEERDYHDTRRKQDWMKEQADNCRELMISASFDGRQRDAHIWLNKQKRCLRKAKELNYELPKKYRRSFD